METERNLATIPVDEVAQHEPLAERQEQEELRRRTRRLQLLARAAAALLGTDDPDSVLSQLFAAVAAEFEVDALFSYVTEDGRSGLRLAWCTGIPDDLRPSLARIELGQSICGLVATTEKPVHAFEIQHSVDPALAVIKGFGIRAYVCEPLISGELLLGTLSFASRRRERFDDDELEFFRTIAQYVAIMRQRIRTERTLAQANDELERRVAERTHQLTASNERLRCEVAERHRAEQELRRREEDYRALYNYAPAPQHSLDATGTILGVSDYWLALMGYRREEVVGRHITEFLTAGSVERFHETHDDFLRSGEGHNEEYSFRTSAGDTIETLVSRRVERDDAGNLVRTIAVLNDVTARRRAERERDRLFDISMDLIAIAGVDGRFRDINQALAEALGYPRHELIGARYVEFIHPDDRARTMIEIERLTAGEPLVRFEIRYRYCDGSWRWASLRVTADRERGILYGIGRDTTERRQTEEVLRQAQKMEAVGQLTGGIAHDFNNLLTVIQGNLELMRPRLEDQPRLSRMIDAMQHAAERGERLTGQLLAFSRRQKLRPETLDVNARVRMFRPLIQRAVGESIAIEMELAPDLWFCTIDPAQLETALLNLSVNARDAMPAGGRLTIATENVEHDAALTERFSDAKPGPYVAVTVRDTGTGMPEEMLHRVFEPFFSTKEVGKGTGLGLSQVYGFVTQSGGQVTIDSAMGQGTTIRLYLPPAEETAAPVEAPVVQVHDVGRGSGNILVVEDDTDVLRVAVEIMTDLGYTVRTAAAPHEALDLLRGSGAIDLLFSDVVMPQMSGVQLAREARRLRPGLKVLLTSGYSHEVLSSRQVLAEGLPVLAKPYKPAELSAQLRRLIGAG